MLVGSNVGGVLGALIAVPLSAVIYTLLKELMDYIEKQKHPKEEIEIETE